MRVNTMGQMVSELAHEINQPLYAIANYAAACRELLGAILQPAPPMWYPGSNRSPIRRIAPAKSSVTSAVSFARSRRAEPHALGDLLKDVSRLLELDARSHAGRIQLILATQSATLSRLVLIDRTQIEQVIVNLVLNAIEAMDHTAESDRPVTITCSYTDAEAEVAVRDRGVGARDNDFKQLFEPFFSTKPDGMGMGLTISQSIVEAHGGRLWATANPDRGMTFHFTLPLPPTDAAPT